MAELHNPVLVGLCLAAFGICWVLAAALMSLLWPAAPGRRETPFIPEPRPRVDANPLVSVRRQADQLYGDLALRVRLLETGRKPEDPSQPSILFDQKLTFLKSEVETLRRVLGNTVLWESARSDLEGRLEAMANRVDSLAQAFGKDAESAAPGTLSFAEIFRAARPHAVASFERSAAAAPDWREYLRGFLQDVRRERAELLERQQLRQEEALRRRRESALESDRLRSDAALAADAEAGLRNQRKALSKDIVRFSSQQESLAREKAADVPPPVLAEREEINRRLRAQTEGARAAMERDREAQDRREKRLRRRLERWRRGWERRLAESGASIATELAALTAQNEAAKAAVERQRKEADAALAALEKERARLEAERQRFLHEVEEPWRQERSDRQRRLTALAEENTLLEREIRTLEEKRREEQTGFEKSLAAERRAVRELQAQWRQDLDARLAETERRRAIVETEAAETRRQLEREKAEAETGLQNRRRDVERAAGNWDETKSSFEGQASTEKERLEKELSESAARVRQAQEIHDKLRAALEEEFRGRERRRTEHRDWARRRMDNLATVLETVQKDASHRLADLQAEKSALQQILSNERARFAAAVRALDNEFEVKRRRVDETRLGTEKEHAEFAARCLAQEEEDRRRLAELVGSVEVMEKKLLEYRRETDRRLQKQREAYERVLLGMEQRVSQDQVSSEARLAQEKMALESLTKRTSGRQARVEKALARRREALDKVFQEAQEAFEVVQQGQWREKRAGSLRLDDLRKQQQALEERKNQIAPGFAPDLYERKKRELDELFEAEKARLSREAEEHWKGFLDKSASNQESMKKAMAALEEAGRDLDRQEAAANDLVATVKNQMAHLKALQDRFRIRDDRGDAGAQSAGSSVA